MGEHKSAGVLVRRPPGPETGDGDEVELVSTQMLKQILSSRDVDNRKGVADVARREGDGVLARDPQTGYFVILDEAELKAIVESGQALPKLSRPSDVTASPLHDYADNDHLSLVSVQALRRVIDEDSGEEDSPAGDADEDEVAEFDPYRA